MKPGLVSLVGAGPGDPELLTLKAARRLQACAALVYDALVPPAILNLAPPSALRVFVGKRDRVHAMPQEKINELLIELARQGGPVVRLKGGDPYLFGRGSEEGEALARAEIPWEMVPGVSSALAVPAYAGIPLTDRRASSMVTIVSGHECTGKTGAAVDWKGISPRGTLVVLMGLARLDAICQGLLAAGWRRDTPAAILASVGWPGEAVASATLEDLPRAAKRRVLPSPAIIVVGEVVGLRRWLCWRQTQQGGKKHVERREARARAGR